MTDIHVHKFQTILTCYEQGEYSEAFEQALELLASNESDIVLQRTILALLIAQSRLEEALDFAAKHALNDEQFKLNCAYCYYKLRKFSEAEEILRKIKTANESTLHLKAQMAYKNGRFYDAIQLYEKLLTLHNQADDSTYSDILTNYYASAAAFYFYNGKHMQLITPVTTKQTFESLYNFASIELAQGNLERALALLNDSLDLCKNYFANEGATKEVVDAEIIPILTQIGYIHSLTGDIEKAKEVFNIVASSNASDVGSIIIGTNNALAASKPDELKKNLKETKWNSLIRNPDLSLKLLPAQLRTLHRNDILFLCTIGKITKAQDEVRERLGVNPNDDELLMLEHYLKELASGNEGAVIPLENSAKSSAFTITMCLIQSMVQKNQYQNSIDMLKQFYFDSEPISENSHEWSLRAIAVLIHLYRNTNQIVDGLDTLKKSYDIHSKLDLNTCSQLKKIMALYRLRVLREKINLAEIFHELHVEYPNDKKILAALVLVSKSAESDLYYAKLSSSQSFDKVSSNIEDIWTLTSFSTYNVMQKKKKRKHKKPIPKDYDPNKTPDPERWLPMRMRSYFKLKKKTKPAHKTENAAKPAAKKNQPKKKKGKQRK